MDNLKIGQDVYVLCNYIFCVRQILEYIKYTRNNKILYGVRYKDDDNIREVDQVWDSEIDALNHLNNRYKKFGMWW